MSGLSVGRVNVHVVDVQQPKVLDNTVVENEETVTEEE